ncbi:AAA family ATPase [Candidatus Woesearchaeota archaeon]|nr:AAA family ATPase [Candidatus Woesearchaeota archaeon]
MIFIQKYKPQKLEEIPQENIIKLKKLLSIKKKGIFVYGPTGCGKSAAIEIILKDYDVVEIDPSNYMGREEIENRLIKSCKENSLFGKQKLFLIDNINGISGTNDRGCVGTIVELIDKSVFSVLIVGNDPYDIRLKALLKVCTLVEFKLVDGNSIFNILKKISEIESITYEENDLKIISRRCGGDLRGAINDLQAASSSGYIDLKGIDERTYETDIFNGLKLVFKSRSLDITKNVFANVNYDFNEFILWLEENLPLEYKGEDLMNAYDQLGRATIFETRIIRWQYWRYLVYVIHYISSGIAFAKKEKSSGFVQYKRTMKPLRIWQMNMKLAKKKEIIEKMKVHCSKKKLFKEFRYYKLFLPYALTLDKEEIKWLNEH